MGNSRKFTGAARQARRLAATAGLTLAAVAAGSGAAQASPPDRGSFSITESFVDTEVCAPEGFAVDVTQTDSATFTIFRNADGSVARVLYRWDYTAAISANGHAITERDRFQTFYYPDGTSRNAGLTVHIQGPG